MVVGVIAFIVWDRWKDAKKEDGSADRLKELKDRLDRHLELEAQENIDMEKLRSRVTAIEGERQIQETHLFNQNATIFTKIEKLDEKIDQRFLVINEDIKEILKEMRK
jgi:hypothetical protein